MLTNISNLVLPSSSPELAKDQPSGLDMALETIHLSRAGPGKILVDNISVQMQPGRYNRSPAYDAGERRRQAR